MALAMVNLCRYYIYMLYEGELEEYEALERAKQVAPAPFIAPAIPAKKAVITLPDTDDVRELAKAATVYAVKALVDIVTDDNAAAGVKIAAATALLDRAHGKAHQSTTVNGSMSLTVVCAIPHTPNSIKTIEH